jgi:predicted carbohydrate-binding protein with CBM5 and CBM33 domain
MLNKMLLTLFEVVLLGVFVLRRVESHGYMKVPPNRGSAWREDPIKFPAYYQDNGLYCGDSSIMMNSVNRKNVWK